MRRHSQLPVIAAMAISAAIGGCRHPTRICCPEPQPPVFLQQDSDLVDKIELSFDLGPAVRSDSLLAGTWSIRINDVNLLVYILQDGAPSFYRVTNGTEIFYFREYPAERTSDGLPLWRIWRWEDEPFLPPGGASARTRQANTHWGIIKRLWS